MKHHLMVCSMLALVCLIGCGQTRSPQQQLNLYVEAEQKNLPRVVDELTTLVDLQAKPLEIVYVYEITSLSDEDIKASTDSIKQSVREGLVREKDKLQDLTKGRIKMTYVYRGQTDADLIRFSMNPWEL
ncbi:MAG: hypothetical protein RIK87_10515 [Fuerstiella sp.]